MKIFNHLKLFYIIAFITTWHSTIFSAVAGYTTDLAVVKGEFGKVLAKFGDGKGKTLAEMYTAIQTLETFKDTAKPASQDYKYKDGTEVKTGEVTPLFELAYLAKLAQKNDLTPDQKTAVAAAATAEAEAVKAAAEKITAEGAWGGYAPGVDLDANLADAKTRQKVVTDAQAKVTTCKTDAEGAGNKNETNAKKIGGDGKPVHQESSDKYQAAIDKINGILLAFGDGSGAGYIHVAANNVSAAQAAKDAKDAADAAAATAAAKAAADAAAAADIKNIDSAAKITKIELADLVTLFGSGADVTSNVTINDGIKNEVREKIKTLKAALPKKKAFGVDPHKEQREILNALETAAQDIL